jgi:phosphoglycerol transferase MdoB-like AlkP superfamily enzyme
MMGNFLESISKENNKLKLIFHFLLQHLNLVILFFLFLFIWIGLYRLVKVKEEKIENNKVYYFSSIFGILISSALIVMMARGGDFSKSTRPITLIDAMDNLSKPVHSDVVLNTSFTIIRTWGKNSFKKSTRFNDFEIASLVKPIKNYNEREVIKKPNIVIFIIESMGREYWGELNKNRNIKNFKSFTPFLDSLSKHSLIFPNAFATSRKSIHGMPSVLAGVPSFEIAYTSSYYSRQKLESLVSISNALGYDTSFLHGAKNGSMGFQGFANTLGYNNYYGRDEFNNDEEYDGFWGIWDEPFLQFSKSILDDKNEPFLATIFTLTSHEPYIIPDKFKGMFDKGYLPIHKCVGYTDYSIRQFFKSIEKSSWFENTIFIFTSDHTNQSYYRYYQSTVNRFATPLLIYKKNSEFVGFDNRLASHLDIYPTVAELIGYKKPFRSWGRSLLSGKNEPSFTINYFGGSAYLSMDENFICVYDGNKAIGFYNLSDLNLEENLIQNKNQNMLKLEKKTGLFLQDYFNRIINNKMFYNLK